MKPVSKYYFKYGIIGTLGETPSIPAIEFPIRIPVKVHDHKELVLLTLVWLKVVEGAQGSVIFKTTGYGLG